jgi:hypothetical protein
MENRLFLCDVTARTLYEGMALPGIRTPERSRLRQPTARGPSPGGRTGRGGFVGRLVRQTLSLLAHRANAPLVPLPAMPSIAPL